MTVQSKIVHVNPETGEVIKQDYVGGAAAVNLRDSSGNEITSFGDASPDTLAQPLPFNSVTTWQEYEFPAGSNITYLTVQVVGKGLVAQVVYNIAAVIYLDQDSVAARTAIVGDSGDPIAVATGGPIPGLYMCKLIDGVLRIPIQQGQALSAGAFGGGIIAVRSLDGSPINVVVTAG